MQDLIEEFITDVFSPEYAANIRKAFSLFEAFEHQNAYSGMVDSITNESVSDIHSRAENFSVVLANQLDFVIKQHLIRLTDQATLADRIMILDALYRVQHLEDYTSITCITSLEEDAIDKMARIFSELVTIRDQSYFLTILESVDDRAIQLLEQFIEQKERSIPHEPADRKIIERIRLFSRALGNKNVGYDLIEAGMMIGLKLNVYLSYVQDHLVDETKPDDTAINILSIIYMSDTPEQDMLTVYRNIADQIFKAPDLAGKVEAVIVRLMAKISDTRNVEHEKTGLS